MTIKDDVEKLLEAFWDKRVIEVSEDPGSIDDLYAPLDSITACEALIDVDELLKTKIPVEVVIKHGGYKSKSEFVDSVTAGVLQHYDGKAA